MYSFAQLEQLWIAAGGSQDVAPIMAAIALAESGGNPNALNTTDNGGTQTSQGLWQVSMGTHQLYNDWSDPLQNARIAVEKYETQGLGAWGTYTSGAYEQFLQGGAAQAAPGAVAAAVSGVSSAAPSASDWPVATQRTIVVLVAIGLGYILWGAVT